MDCIAITRVFSLFLFSSFFFFFVVIAVFLTPDLEKGAYKERTEP